MTGGNTPQGEITKSKESIYGANRCKHYALACIADWGDVGDLVNTFFSAALACKTHAEVQANIRGLEDLELFPDNSSTPESFIADKSPEGIKVEFEIFAGPMQVPPGKFAVKIEPFDRGVTAENTVQSGNGPTSAYLISCIFPNEYDPSNIKALGELQTSMNLHNHRPQLPDIKA